MVQKKTLTCFKPTEIYFFQTLNQKAENHLCVT